MTYNRKQIRDLCAQGTPEADALAKELLMSLTKDELLSSLEEEAQHLLDLVNGIPDLILENLDKQLETDESSYNEMRKLMARL